MDKKAIFRTYADYVWLYNKEPESIAEFCNFASIATEDFTQHFDGVTSLKKTLLTNVFESAYERVLIASEENEYSNRERCLALFFTLIEEFQAYKKYLAQRYQLKNTPSTMEEWRPFNQLFVEKTRNLNTDSRVNWLRDKLPGKITSEVNGILVGWNYVFRVWLADDTEEQTTTDAAIEKTVHLYFDFATTNQMEQLLDFGKFLMSTKLN
jgi:hypothetical protein